jgi:hypothetical protein
LHVKVYPVEFTPGKTTNYYMVEDQIGMVVAECDTWQASQICCRALNDAYEDLRDITEEPLKKEGWEVNALGMARMPVPGGEMGFVLLFDRINSTFSLTDLATGQGLRLRTPRNMGDIRQLVAWHKMEGI